MEKIKDFVRLIGLILFFIGAGAMDSPSMKVPVLILTVGMMLLVFSSFSLVDNDGHKR